MLVALWQRNDRTPGTAGWCCRCGRHKCRRGGEAPLLHFQETICWRKTCTSCRVALALVMWTNPFWSSTIGRVTLCRTAHRGVRWPVVGRPVSHSCPRDTLTPLPGTRRHPESNSCSLQKIIKLILGVWICCLCVSKLQRIFWFWIKNTPPVENSVNTGTMLFALYIEHFYSGFLGTLLFGGNTSVKLW